MKRVLFVSLFLIACLCMNGFIVAPATVADTSPDVTNVVNEVSPDPQLVLEARLENLLNINYIYGDDILDNEKLLNKAAISLKSLADDNGFIEQTAVTSFIKDLYDIDLVITDDMNSDMPKKEGYVYLIPRGYTKYEHTITGISVEDGVIRVTSAVKVNYHDSEATEATATTIFVENQNSRFGYNIVSSEINYNINSLAI